jgi:hypothetical protein
MPLEKDKGDGPPQRVQLPLFDFNNLTNMGARGRSDYLCYLNKRLMDLDFSVRSAQPEPFVVSLI